MFGAIQSTVNSVLNSTATVFTLDIYKRLLRPAASDKHLVNVGVVSSVVVLAVAIVLGGFIGRLGGGLFVYIQSLYAFFAPPFAAVFLLGILWRRINSRGALAAVIFGFAFGIGVKLYLEAARRIRPGWNPTPTRRRSTGCCAAWSARPSAWRPHRRGPSRWATTSRSIGPS